MKPTTLLMAVLLVGIVSADRRTAVNKAIRARFLSKARSLDAVANEFKMFQSAEHGALKSALTGKLSPDLQQKLKACKNGDDFTKLRKEIDAKPDYKNGHAIESAVKGWQQGLRSKVEGFVQKHASTLKDYLTKNQVKSGPVTFSDTDLKIRGIFELYTVAMSPAPQMMALVEEDAEESYTADHDTDTVEASMEDADNMALTVPEDNIALIQAHLSSDAHLGHPLAALLGVALGGLAGSGWRLPSVFIAGGAVQGGSWVGGAELTLDMKRKSVHHWWYGGKEFGGSLFTLSGNVYAGMCWKGAQAYHQQDDLSNAYSGWFLGGSYTIEVPSPWPPLQASFGAVAAISAKSKNQGEDLGAFIATIGGGPLAVKHVSDACLCGGLTVGVAANPFKGGVLGKIAKFVGKLPGGVSATYYNEIKPLTYSCSSSWVPSLCMLSEIIWSPGLSLIAGAQYALS